MRVLLSLLLLIAGACHAQTPGRIGIGTSTIEGGTFVGTNHTVTAPQWIDIPVSYAYSVTGPNAPGLVGVSGGSPIQLLAFDNTDLLYGIAQWPHFIATTNATTPVLYYEPHVHFTVLNAPAGANSNVTWRLIRQFANVNEQFGTACFTNTVTMGVTTSNTQYLAEFGHFTNNTMGITGVFRCRLDRPASAQNDYGSGQTVILNGFDIHVPVGNTVGFGSRQDTVQ